MHRTRRPRCSADLSSGSRICRQRRLAIRCAISLDSQNGFGGAHTDRVSAGRGAIQHDHTCSATAAVVGAGPCLRRIDLLTARADTHGLNARSSGAGAQESSVPARQTVLFAYFEVAAFLKTISSSAFTTGIIRSGLGELGPLTYGVPVEVSWPTSFNASLSPSGRTSMTCGPA